MDRIRCVPNVAVTPVDAETERTDVLLTETRNTTWHVVFSILFPAHAPPPPDHAQCEFSVPVVVDCLDTRVDFVGVETPEDVERRQERLALRLEMLLDHSATELQELLGSPEYQLGLARSAGMFMASEIRGRTHTDAARGTEALVAAATRLMALITMVPFVAEAFGSETLQDSVLVETFFTDQWDLDMLEFGSVAQRGG